jgi:hypothetical protein
MASATEPGFVPRPDEYTALKRAMLDGGNEPVAITAALRGAEGTCLCRHPLRIEQKRCQFISPFDVVVVTEKAGEFGLAKPAGGRPQLFQAFVADPLAQQRAHDVVQPYTAAAGPGQRAALRPGRARRTGGACPRFLERSLARRGLAGTLWVDDPEDRRPLVDRWRGRCGGDWPRLADTYALRFLPAHLASLMASSGHGKIFRAHLVKYRRGEDFRDAVVGYPMHPAWICGTFR